MSHFTHGGGVQLLLPPHPSTPALREKEVNRPTKL